MGTHLTEYHAKYYAHDLTRIGGSGVDRLGRVLFDASVDLNPHQIEAALFALRSPLVKGVLMADEVGLGKTIEAGLVLCQSWAERKRKILIICPASLRKQWAIELEEKFNLPSQILDGNTFKKLQNSGVPNPFDTNKIVICSMHFVANRSDHVRAVPWHYVVIDEAHKLRNTYKESNRIGNAIRLATAGRKKLLLTATPLQNSLLELYGLSLLIDENIFGDLEAFKMQYLRLGGDAEGLRERLQYFSWRTLRSQVTEYVSYTNRNLITQPFVPTEKEQALYDDVSNYIQREGTYAIPSAQRHLLVLLLRKMLASSPIALAGTLEAFKIRLQALRLSTEENAPVKPIPLFTSDVEDEVFDQLLLEQNDDKFEGLKLVAEKEDPPYKIVPVDLDNEIEELATYIKQAYAIGVDTKTKALMTALNIGFDRMSSMGAAQKAVIFTESTRTQKWLIEYLLENGYNDAVIAFNGSNKSDTTKKIYQHYLAVNANNGKITGSKQVDIRMALLDYFKSDAKIMVATEAGAEGLNMQFCSLVVNFDLPWNPQRIEQRIGRCHRYGQKFDVVVINFLNQKNEADKRVHELLEHKFNLFSGVFGASDDVLGSLASGLDFEKRIAEIYQSCRTEDEIKVSFDALQKELEDSIKVRMADTRKVLLEHFDEDVHHRFKESLIDTEEKLDKIGKTFWALTQYMLTKQAEFQNSDHSFSLNAPFDEFSKLGQYQLVSKNRNIENNDFLYRLTHPLGKAVIDKAKNLPCNYTEVCFDITNNSTKISLVEKLKGNSGWMTLQHLNISSFEEEEYLLFSALDTAGNNIEQETCEKLFRCMATSHDDVAEIPVQRKQQLQADCKRHIDATITLNLEENSKFLNDACVQLDKWAEDLEKAATKAMRDTKRKIAEARRKARMATNLQEQSEIQKELGKLGKQRRKQQKEIFDFEDEVEEKRDNMIAQLTERMKQSATTTTLFTIQWRVI